MSTTEQKGAFDIHASIVFQLGESLITDVFQALAELAKNSYDADATYANIEIDANGSPPEGSDFPNAKGYIVVADNGHGMDIDELKMGWLTISNSLKKQMKAAGKTTERGRTPLGDKGLGRLGVQRLGENVEIITRPDNKNFDLILSFSWASFRNEKALGTVPITIKTRTPAIRKKGTKIIISQINSVQWQGTEVETKIQEELSKIISPFTEIRDFNIRAKIQGKSVDLMEVSEKVRSAAQVKYDIIYKDGKFEISGKASIGFLRTKDNEREVKNLIDRDGGKKFLTWLCGRKKAQGIGLKAIENKKEKRWLVEFKKELPLIEMPGLALDEGAEIADPGAFFGEVDFYDLGDDDKKMSIFGKTKAFKDLIKSQSGIRVYRDGFGIRLDQDWLELGRQWTSATSYYGLKPQNTLGFISISAKHNSRLEETTNREGFKVTPYYENFRGLLDVFVSFAQHAQGTIRREWTLYKNIVIESNVGLSKEAPSEEMFARADLRLNKAEKLSIPMKESMRKISELKFVSLKALKSIDSETNNTVVEARKKLKLATAQLDGISESFEKAVEFVNDAREIRLNNLVIKNRFEQMREQMSQLYDAVSLGLTVEAFTHELLNVIDNMLYRTRKIEKLSLEGESAQKKLEVYFEFIGASIGTLKKQLAHLSPSLKYVRDKKEIISLAKYFDDLQNFYHARFSSKGIELQIGIKSSDFTIKISRGKMNQIIENLLLNSEYWLMEDMRIGKIKSGKILIEVDKPNVRMRDNGRGIAASIEPVIFEPFQTTKRRGEGRGLGLFVVNQLLLADDCSISLLSDLNKLGRPFIFEINLSGVLDA